MNENQKLVWAAVWAAKYMIEMMQPNSYMDAAITATDFAGYAIRDLANCEKKFVENGGEESEATKMLKQMLGKE